MRAKFPSFEELLGEYLENPEFAMSFLNQALADEDIEAFKLSLKDIIRVHGKVSHLAKEAHLRRGTPYKLMQGFCSFYSPFISFIRSLTQFLHVLYTFFIHN